ncbi:MAG TPA: heterodisulfide reductase-related iron-sulfur binding cluster [Pseudomonadales bacterium]
MADDPKTYKEGNLEAPTRHPLNQNDPAFYDPASLNQELERVFDICHGCRRCVSLCNSFPTLFDLVDESSTMEVDGVDTKDYQKVVDQCYLCDLCYLTKCPYVPPHEWNVDFPHLMLRAKAVNFKQGKSKLRDKIITSTDLMGKTLAQPLIAPLANTANKTKLLRKALDKVAGIHQDARLPEYHYPTLRKTIAGEVQKPQEYTKTASTTGKVIFFTTCYCNYNEPDMGDDFVAVYQHNQIQIRLMTQEHCCGMPKLELGDLDSVTRLQEKNIPQLAELVKDGWDIVALVPSCVLMFKQELPLMFPDNADVQLVSKAFFDPFEYLHLRYREGEFNTDFKHSLGNISYHAACHQRVQNIGPKTRDVLQLIPNTKVTSIERCSGHDGTYAVKSETHDIAKKLVKPVVKQIEKQAPDYYGSDCPMAAHHIESNLAEDKITDHPISLLRKAYGI